MLVPLSTLVPTPIGAAGFFVSDPPLLAGRAGVEGVGLLGASSFGWGACLYTFYVGRLVGWVIVSGFDCTVNLNVNRGLLDVNTRDVGIRSFTRTVGSMLSEGRATVDRGRTHRVMGGCFRRLRAGLGTRGVRGKGSFLRRGTGEPKIIALPDNLRCRIVARNGKGGPDTASHMGYRCRNALVSKALFSDSVGHNRPTVFNIGRMVGK